MSESVGVDVVAGFSSCGNLVEPSPKGNPRVLQEKALQVLATLEGLYASFVHEEATLLTLQRVADAAGVAFSPLTPEGLEPILGAMKLAG